jgi:hypothetical protein
MRGWPRWLVVSALLVSTNAGLDCATPTGGDGDVDADVEAESDADADTGGDADGDTDTDSDIDSDTDADSDVDTDSDLDSDGDTPECAPVPDPEPVADAPLPGESPPGRSEATTVDRFNDEYLYDATDYIKIGVRREWGGSVIFFGLVGDGAPGMNGTNTIDANDTGREVQVAFYDPDRAMQNCAWDAACATRASECPSSITFLGWDPVQGGNRCNVGSGVDSVTNADGVLAVTTTPLFWNPAWDRTDCSSDVCGTAGLRDRRSEVHVVQSIRFVRTHVVEITYSVENPADTDHAPTLQEMPTLYSANGRRGPDLWRLFDSTSTQVPIDTPAGGDGFYYENFESPGGWVSLQNESAEYGVGIYYENRLTSFQGWQLRSLPFNNVRARFGFGLPARTTVRARAYLILGSLATVAAEAAWLDANLAPFGYLDTPRPDEPVGGTITVAGWALDNRGIASVALWVDGVRAAELSYGRSRPDVCIVWPGYPGCPDVGFEGTFDVSSLTPCAHLLEVRATDTDGNERTIARRRVTVVR